MMVAATWFNAQIVFDGVVQGLAIAVIAVGVVLIYRATRIINFAVGNMGVVGAVTLSLLTIQYNVPFWAALVIALLIGLAFGAIVEMTVIRRLKAAPPRCRPRCHHRHRRFGTGDRHRDPCPVQSECALPERLRWIVDRGGSECARRRPGSGDPGSPDGARPHLVLGPHHDRQDRQGLCRESVTGEVVLHLAQTGVDHGVGSRGGSVDTVGRPDRRGVLDGGRTGHSGPSDPRGSPRGGGDRRHAVLQGGRHRRRGDRRHSEHAHVQLPGGARYH